MAECGFTSLNGFKLADLLSNDGVMFEIGEPICDEDEEFGYTPFAQYSNEEILNMLNMNDFENDEDKEQEAVLIYGISFDKLKTKMTNLTSDGKVMKFIKQKGVGEVIPNNAQVTIHYLGYLEDNDEPFDSTYICGKPKTLRLEQGMVIPGLELGIASMRKHEISVFWLHPDYAYKAIGCQPRIPPNAEIVFIVHLIDFIDNGSADTYYNLSLEDKQSFPHVVESVMHRFATAKDHFAKQRYKTAIREYKKITDCLEIVKLKDNAEEHEMKKLLSKAYTNLGVCFNKIDMPRNACAYCFRVPFPTVKTHYTFGQALLRIAEYDEAMKELQKAYKLDPHDAYIKKAIQQTNMKQRRYLEIEKRLWKNCFKSEKNKTKATEFRQAARELCESVQNNILRQSLPEGFTEEELEIIREEAAASGLSIVKHIRYGKEVIYIQKNNA
ncbi:PREDICTED: inactive peptidyl-prolyl cis-trans isomerase FKBP6 [Dinoponera quadriceps]|uniref:peptidylprolyl isomerase n=1 Tax=Dinoponera quadriceps TaxID=609295 RepID=A0A6P3XC30_DINQU|nr:PREDICTED: inactive peptidyl-prolyl cis-trans isomerase FKBP6 [Dinoponera quadriceps]